MIDFILKIIIQRLHNKWYCWTICLLQ